MMNTDEIQGGAGSGFLARLPRSKQRSDWQYHLREFARSQRQGGHGRYGTGGGQRGSQGRGGEPRGAGGEPPGRNQARLQSPVSTDSDFQQRTLGDLSRASAILQGVHDALMGPAGASPPSLCSSQACLLAELPLSIRERPLSGPLFQLLEVLAEGSPGAVPAGGVTRDRSIPAAPEVGVARL